MTTTETTPPPATPSSAPPPARDFEALFAPRVVALVGASANPTKWGHLLARNLLRGAGRRTVRLVTRSGGEILGQPAFRSLGELPEAPELVIVAVPQSSVAATVEEALEAGARAIVVITVGFRERDADGAALEQALVARVRAAGALLIGPNCNGIWDAGAELDAMTWLDDPQGGSLGVVSQSGGVITELVSLGPRNGIGFSRLVSFGNQADVDAAELVRALTADPATEVIAAYVEEFRDGRAFLAASADAIAAGKPVILLSPPASVATRRAVASHTGSLLGDDVARRAACRAVGIVPVETPPQLIAAVEALRTRRVPRGPRVGVVSDGGGQAVLGAGSAVSHGFEVPRFSDALDAALQSATAGASARRNPVDITGGSHFELSDYASAIRTVAASGEVDAVVFTGMFGGYERQSREYVADELAAAEAIVADARASEIPVVVHTWYADTAAARVLRAGGVPVFEDVATAMEAVALLRERGLASGLPERVAADADAARDAVADASEDPYWRGRALLARAGIAAAPARPARTADEAVAAAREVGYPLVLKALGGAHKSDDGGVVLGVADDAGLRAEVARIHARRPGAPLAVEALVGSGGVELLIGVRDDPSFGPLVLVGAGGLHAELFDDVAVALAPVDDARAESLVRALQIAPLLDGARGRPPLDVAAAARAVAALSRLVAADRAIAELEANPLLVTENGAIALDAHVVARSDEAPSPAPTPAARATTVAGLVSTARARIRGLSAQQLSAERERRDPVVIDVRDIRERWRDGAIPGAEHVPRGMLEFWADPASEYHREALDPQRPVVVYCAGGWRSALAAVTLEQLGYQDVAHLEDGFDGWKSAGGEWVEVPRR